MAPVVTVPSELPSMDDAMASADSGACAAPLEELPRPRPPALAPEGEAGAEAADAPAAGAAARPPALAPCALMAVGASASATARASRLQSRIARMLCRSAGNGGREPLYRSGVCPCVASIAIFMIIKALVSIERVRKHK